MMEKINVNMMEKINVNIKSWQSQLFILNIFF